MPAPYPTPVFRLIHIDNLPIILKRGGIHAPNYTPRDGLIYRTIHDTEIQSERRVTKIPCGPCGVIHDYVPFYFGYLTPMLLRLKTGRLEGYIEGQEPILYLVSYAQNVKGANVGFCFSDGHGIATFTHWFVDLNDLEKVDWDMVYQRYWTDNVNDLDRQRRKQAEFLIHKFCDWSLIVEIGVIHDIMKNKVETVINGFPSTMRRPVVIHRDWYY